MKKIVLILGSLLAFNTNAASIGGGNLKNQMPLNAHHQHHMSPWHLRLSFGQMTMNDNYQGRKKISAQQIINQGYMMAGEQMPMSMGMVDVMYMPTMQTHFMMMVPFQQNTMRMLTMGGNNPHTMSKGLGDVSLSMSQKVIDKVNQSVSIQAGVSLPTGSIDKRDNTPMGPRQLLPYPMQLGSGTYDVLLGSRFNQAIGLANVGLNVNASLPLARNSKNYALGNRVHIGLWVSRTLNQSNKASLGVNAYHQGKIRGQARELNPGMSPYADANRQGGERMDVEVQYLFTLPDKVHQQSLEFGVKLPFYQRLNGPQMAISWQANVAYNIALG